MIVAVIRMKIHRRPVGHHRQSICSIVPEVISTAQTTEPEVVAVIRHSRDKIRFSVVTFIRLVNHSDTGPQCQSAFCISRVHRYGGQHTERQNFNFGHKKSFLSQNFSAESILTRKTATSILFYPYLPVPLYNVGFSLKQTGSGRAGENSASCQGVSGWRRASAVYRQMFQDIQCRRLPCC